MSFEVTKRCQRCLICLSVGPGAGQDVGRSCILVSIAGKNVMLDCGMHMGYNDDVSMMGKPDVVQGYLQGACPRSAGLLLCCPALFIII